MTKEAFDIITNLANETLPDFKKSMPFYYWHVKTLLVLANTYDLEAVKELAELLVTLLDIKLKEKQLTLEEPDQNDEFSISDCFELRNKLKEWASL